jgi:hypothetical protein
MSVTRPLYPQLLSNWCRAAKRRDVPYSDIAAYGLLGAGLESCTGSDHDRIVSEAAVWRNQVLIAASTAGAIPAHGAMMVQEHNKAAADGWNQGGADYDAISYAISDALAHAAQRLWAQPRRTCA